MGASLALHNTATHSFGELKDEKQGRNCYHYTQGSPPGIQTQPGVPSCLGRAVSLTTQLELSAGTAVSGIDGIPWSRLGLVSPVSSSWTNTAPPTPACPQGEQPMSGLSPPSATCVCSFNFPSPAPRPAPPGAQLGSHKTKKRTGSGLQCFLNCHLGAAGFPVCCEGRVPGQANPGTQEDAKPHGFLPRRTFQSLRDSKVQSESYKGSLVGSIAQKFCAPRNTSWYLPGQRFHTHSVGSTSLALHSLSFGVKLRSSLATYC